MTSTAIVLHELETDQPIDHRLHDAIDIHAAAAGPAHFASTEDKVLLEVAAGAADASDTDDDLGDNIAMVTVRLLLDDDAHLDDIDGLSLARRSTWFARALASSFAESSSSTFDFRGNPYVTLAGMRVLLRWLQDGEASLDNVSGEDLLDALQLSSYLEVQRLLRLIERRLIGAIDEGNALSLLQLADQTGAKTLFSATSAVAVDMIQSLEREAWLAVPMATREFLLERRRLRDAARQLGLPDDALPDAREFVCMLREATALQRERAAEAAEWAARGEAELTHKLGTRVARGEISQMAADAIFQRDTAKPRAALAAQNARIEADTHRLYHGVVTSIIDGWLAERDTPRPCKSARSAGQER